MEIMMKSGEKDQEFDSFFLAFAGQNVILTIDLMNSIASSSEHGSVTETYPIFYEGILLDFDEKNYYLGKTNNPNEITDFVPRNRVIHGKISEGEEEILNEVLNQVKIPEDESEIN